MTDPGGIIPHEAEFLLYRTEDGRARVEVRFDGETAWLTQAGLAELFQTTPQNIGQHVAAIYTEGELDQAATCKQYFQVRREGPRDVRRRLKHYSLPMILAVGYRVRSARGTQFRQWATARLRRRNNSVRLERRVCQEFSSADTMDLLLNSDQTPGTAEDPMTLWHPGAER